MPNIFTPDCIASSTVPNPFNLANVSALRKNSPATLSPSLKNDLNISLIALNVSPWLRTPNPFTPALFARSFKSFNKGNNPCIATALKSPVAEKVRLRLFAIDKAFCLCSELILYKSLIPFVNALCNSSGK